MEVRVRERLIGALVLVALVVLFVPAILKGRGRAPDEPPPETTRRVEVPTSDAPPAPKESVLVPEPAAAAAPTAAEQPKDVTPPSSPRADPPVPKRQEATEAPPKPQPQASALPSATPAWAVQLGAFSNRSKAEQLVAQLKERGYSAFVLEYRASGQVLYRVRVGPEQDRARAEEIAARLAKDGFQTVVARHP